MNPKMNHIYKFTLFLTLILKITFFANLSSATENSAKSISWGGGGAFTSTAQLNDDIYLSSDVAGVWKQANGRWQPYVAGLDNYNVTALAAFNNKLFAITTDELFVTDGNNEWATIGIKLNTYRSTNDQPYSIAADESVLCIGNRNQKIQCIDNNDQVVTYTTPVTVINGVYFDRVDSAKLYFFSGSELYTLDLTTQYIELVEIFNDKIVSMATYNVSTLVATSKNVFDANHLHQSIYEAGSSSIINFFVTQHDNNDVLFISTGSTWGTYPKRFVLVDGTLIQQQRVNTQFDSSLPHRPYQNRLNKFLGVNTLQNTTYITDYWGVYQLQIANIEGDLNLVEVSGDAVNTVATDLVVTTDNVYVSTMDNGVVKITKPVSSAESQYQALAFASLQGHAWSLLQDGDTVHSVISPWNNANDFLFSYNELNASTQVSQLTDFSSRQASGAFWGQGYARQLANYNGIMTFRDGANGGLVTHGANPIENNHMVTLGEQNRVYRAFAVHHDLLYIANCEGLPVMVAVDETGETLLSKALPSGFCPFTAYSTEDRLYLLGSESGKSAIYQFINDEFTLLLKESAGSAFYQMAINPLDDQQMVAGTITWSNRASSGLFVSNDGGNTFFDKSCLLSHKNGVAAIKFDNDNAYILHKVGGIRVVPAALLFSEYECNLDAEIAEPAVTEDPINFNLLSMQGYGGAQDTAKGTVSIADDGATLKLTGNRWRAANFDYELTPNTVIEFEFKSSKLGEIHGLGLDNDLSLTATKTLNIFGTQAYGLQQYRYSGSGEYEHFSIPVGEFYTGHMKYLFFAMDQDTYNPKAESYFRNVKVVER